MLTVRREDGIALITALLLLGVMMLLVLIVIPNALQTNRQSTDDKLREQAFQAANAGVDDALNCLATVSGGTPVATCSRSSSASTILTDAGTQVGQFDYTVTELSASPKVVRIESTGYGPTKASARAKRRIEATVELASLGGFTDALFAGGTPPGSGQIDIRNNSTVNGSIYARGSLADHNNSTAGDVRVVGDVRTDNNNTYRSVWSGRSLVLDENTLVTTFAKACGAGGSPGDATLLNNARVRGNITYRGALTLGNNATVDGARLNAACDPPPVAGIPTYAFDAANYPGWTIIQFTSFATANACLATRTAATCNGQTLGASPGTMGRPAPSGTIVRVNDPACPSDVRKVSFDDPPRVAGNFTLATNCKVVLPNNFILTTANASSTGQVVLITTSATGAADFDAANNFESQSANVTLLVYAAGQAVLRNNATIASGAVYAGAIDVRNNLTLTWGTSLQSSPPAGFTFDPAIAASYRPVVKHWQEVAP